MLRYEPNYIVSHLPSSSHRYGRDQQDDYVRQSNAAILQTVRKIRDAATEGTDLQTFFHRIFADLSQARQQIAIDHGSIQAQEFGVMRNGGIRANEWVYSSSFINEPPYQEYGQRFRDQFADWVGLLEHDVAGFTETKISKEEQIGPQQSGVDWQVWDLKGQEWFENRKISRWAMCLNQEYPSPRVESCVNGDPVLRGNAAYQKSHLVIAQSYLNDGTRKYPLANYVTWAYCDGQQDPVERMRFCSKIMILHPHSSYIPSTLDKIATIFAKCIMWDQSQPDTELKELMAEWSYLFAHLAPLRRGSAAVREWLEMALYRYHGFDMTFDPTKLGDLEALTALSYSEYLQSYMAAVQLRSREA